MAMRARDTHTHKYILLIENKPTFTKKPLILHNSVLKHNINMKLIYRQLSLLPNKKNL